MFKVHPESLHTAADDFAVCSGHLANAARYHEEPSHFGFFEKGLIMLVKSSHEEFVALLQQRLDEAATALSLSASALAAAGTMYESTDTAAARAVDETLPHVERIDSEHWRGR
jgi:hypothetical protein